MKIQEKRYNTKKCKHRKGRKYHTGIYIPIFPHLMQNCSFTINCAYHLIYKRHIVRRLFYVHLKTAGVLIGKQRTLSSPTGWSSQTAIAGTPVATVLLQEHLLTQPGI